MADIQKGKLIVLEGPDASGKKTQTELLVRNLAEKGILAERVAFPDYPSPWGRLVTQYLDGNSPSIDPAYAAILYSADRAAAAPAIRGKLDAGTWVICDRYVASNLAHQAANYVLRVSDEQSRVDAFAHWIRETEFNVLGIPVPDLTILLNVPYELSLQKGLERKLAEAKGKDLHEDDSQHIRLAWEQYQKLAKEEAWPVIECAPKKELLPREEIAAAVLNQVLSLVD